MNLSPMPDPTAQPAPASPDLHSSPPAPPPYARDAIFDEDGPFDPGFIQEAVRTLMRSLPLDPAEPPDWQDRRMYSALLGLSALHPRDEIEVMLGVQAMSAYHAAAACWRIGMNHHLPNGDSTRHITTAASAARVFDSLLRAIERRQAKPLGIPIGRPAAQTWAAPSAMKIIGGLAERCCRGASERDPATAAQPDAEIVWTDADLEFADAFLQRERLDKQNEGLDIANTEGILPGGGMILTDDPTPAQIAYMARRVGLTYQEKFADDLSNGIVRIPTIQPIRPGDLIP
jgi:hypothetical protein